MYCILLYCIVYYCIHAHDVLHRNESTPPRRLTPYTQLNNSYTLEIQLQQGIPLSVPKGTAIQFYAKAGHHPKAILGQMITQNSVLFITPYSPSRPAGTIPVTLSLNGRDFIDTGHTFTYEDSLPTQIFQTPSIPIPSIFFLSPLSALSGVVTKFTLTGEGFQFTSKCVLGDSGLDIPTLFISDTQVILTNDSPLHVFLLFFRFFAVTAHYYLV